MHGEERHALLQQASVMILPKTAMRGKEAVRVLQHVRQQQCAATTRSEKKERNKVLRRVGIVERISHH